MTEHYEMPHRFADYCPHAGVGKACAPCRRAFGEVYRLAHIDFQTQVQASIDDAVVKLQAAAWDEGAQAAGKALGRMFRNEGAYIEPANPYRPLGEVA